MPRVVKAVAAIGAMAVAVTLYAVPWSYGLYFAIPIGLPLLLGLSAGARVRGPRAVRGISGARGGAADMAASLSVGLFAATVVGGWIADWCLSDETVEWLMRCGLVQPELFWRVAKASVMVSVSLALLCVVGPPGWPLWRRVGRAVTVRDRMSPGADRSDGKVEVETSACTGEVAVPGALPAVAGAPPALSWFSAVRAAVTLAYLALGALLLPVTCVQIASQCLRGFAAPALLTWPSVCAACWTAWEWALRRRVRAVRWLRRTSAVMLAAGVAGSALTSGSRSPEVNGVVACDAPLGFGSWYLLGSQTLAGAYLLFSALAAIALDPERRAN